MVDRYLLDSVTLFKMTEDQRRSPFVHRFCRIPDEVCYEARYLPDASLLTEITTTTTIEVLANVQRVMSTIKPSDGLIDLYNNEGNGDIMLLATALSEMAATEELLFGDRWIIATDDQKLRNKATELGIAVCSAQAFRALVDEAGVQ